MSEYDIHLIGVDKPDFYGNLWMERFLGHTALENLIVEVPEDAVDYVHEISTHFDIYSRYGADVLSDVDRLLRFVSLGSHIDGALEYATRRDIPIQYFEGSVAYEDIARRALHCERELHMALSKGTSALGRLKQDLIAKQGYPLSRQQARKRWDRVLAQERTLCHEFTLAKCWWTGLMGDSDEKLAEMIESCVGRTVAVVDYDRLRDSIFGFTLYSKLKHLSVNRVPQI